MPTTSQRRLQGLRILPSGKLLFRGKPDLILYYFDKKQFIARIKQVLNKSFHVKKLQNLTFYYLFFANVAFATISFLYDPSVQKNVNMDSDEDPREYHDEEIEQKYLHPAQLL